MSTIQVANLNFESTGSNRFEYVSPDTIRLYVGGVLLATLTASGGLVPKYSANVGNSVSTTYSINHFLNKSDVFVSVRDTGTNYFVYPDIKYSNTNVIILEFASAPSTNQYYVSIIGA